MNKRQQRLIRQAAKVDLSADQWRKNLEDWMDCMYPIAVNFSTEVYTGDFGTVTYVVDSFFAPKKQPRILP